MQCWLSLSGLQWLKPRSELGAAAPPLHRRPDLHPGRLWDTTTQDGGLLLRRTLAPGTLAPLRLRRYPLGRPPPFCFRLILGGGKADPCLPGAGCGLPLGGDESRGERVSSPSGVAVSTTSSLVSPSPLGPPGVQRGLVSLNLAQSYPSGVRTLVASQSLPSGGGAPRGMELGPPSGVATTACTQPTRPSSPTSVVRGSEQLRPVSTSVRTDQTLQRPPPPSSSHTLPSTQTLGSALSAPGLQTSPSPLPPGGVAYGIPVTGGMGYAAAPSGVPLLPQALGGAPAGQHVAMQTTSSSQGLAPPFSASGFPVVAGSGSLAPPAVFSAAGSVSTVPAVLPPPGFGTYAAAPAAAVPQPPPGAAWPYPPAGGAGMQPAAVPRSDPRSASLVAASQAVLGPSPSVVPLSTPSRGRWMTDQGGNPVWCPLPVHQQGFPTDWSGQATMWPSPYPGFQPLPPYGQFIGGVPPGTHPLTWPPASGGVVSYSSGSSAGRGVPRPVPPPSATVTSATLAAGVASPPVVPAQVTDTAPDPMGVDCFGDPPVLYPEPPLDLPRSDGPAPYSPTQLSALDGGSADAGGADAESVDIADAPAPVPERRLPQPAQALLALAELAPEAVEVRQVQAVQRSALGGTLPSAQTRQTLLWKESMAVSVALQGAEERLRGRPPLPARAAPSSAPPQATLQSLGMGVYLGSEQPQLSAASYPFRYNKLLEKPVALSTAEKTFAGTNAALKVHLTEAQVLKFEELHLRSLRACSILESSLLGLERALFVPRDEDSPDLPDLQEEIDVDSVAALLFCAARALEDAAAVDATNLANARLMRRDMVLQAKSCTLSQETARNLRAEALVTESVLGPNLPQVKQEQKEERKESLLENTLKGMHTLLQANQSLLQNQRQQGSNAKKRTQKVKPKGQGGPKRPAQSSGASGNSKADEPPAKRHRSDGKPGARSSKKNNPQ